MPESGEPIATAALDTLVSKYVPMDFPMGADRPTDGAGPGGQDAVGVDPDAEPEVLLDQARMERGRYRDEMDPARALACYHRIVTLAGEGAIRLANVREEDYHANDVADPVLWRQLLLWEQAGAALSTESLAGVVAAERVLMERLGVEQYLDELADRRRRAAPSSRAQHQVWRGERSEENAPVFCTRCHGHLAGNVEEAVERYGGQAGALGPWVRCPHCDVPTVIRA